MKKLTIITLAAVVLAGMVPILGCGDSVSDTNVPNAKIWIYGRVIDRTTRAAITDATIEVLAGDKAYVATMDRNETATTLFTESERFRVEVPLADTYDLRIAKTGYATYRNVFAPTGLGGSTMAKYIDLGDLPMALGYDLTVYVVDEDGAPVSGATVYAVESVGAATWTDTDAVLGVGRGFEISDTTDATGVATLPGLNYLIGYSVIVPAYDSDGDGVYNYATTVLDTMDAQITSTTTWTVVLTPVGRDEALALAGMNLKVIADDGNGGAPPVVEFPGVTGGLADIAQGPAAIGTNAVLGGKADVLGMQGDGTAVLVFNYPVSIDATNGDGIYFAVPAVDNILFGSTTGVATFGLLVTQVGATGALSAGNTVLTLTPASALTDNYVYSLNGMVAADVPSTNGDVVTDQLSLTNLDGDITGDQIYIYPTTNGLSSTTVVTLDNNNGTTAGAGAMAAPCFEFPEMVFGTIEVISSTAGAVTTSYNFTGVAATATAAVGGLTFQGGTAEANTPAVNTLGTACAGGALKAEGSGIVYNIASGLAAMSDQVTATPAQVTIYVDVQDTEGNRLTGEQTLNVQ